ncbi:MULTISPECIES: SRPBCC domain-containing protein [unclassified Mesorhizobium]|uniref:SRPBCC family protein n=1 Tax=unclassified Mesorhizobium TaxID=325217 RepID=UPI000FDA2331|nr:MULTISPECIES: SRPBCC domain-containing protein [unclassified Mesorhizobium]TGQ29080.1 SRPBCC domain-containing protein [Mesorhizobium sp. M00.F.Ca.ET.216.01.1.1]TIS58664.1 MAG: SRPBCC domain-containing protein [Mesorhizobium sp.]TIS85546.1 MAG: SRPBCC domain-containing protein [Mesorhizobium sp.]
MMPTMHAMTNGETVLASADINSPPERVFSALVTDEVERWWGSADIYRMTGWSADLRVGGRWSVIVRTADGRRLPAGGEFLEIEAPRRIVQTRKYEWDHPTLGRRETKVAYLLEPIATGTRVTICHGGFAGLVEAAAEHAEGWGRVLGWLQVYVSANGRVAA